MQRKNLVFSFLQDKERMGEYFIAIDTPTHTPSINNETGFAELPQSKQA